MRPLRLKKKPPSLSALPVPQAPPRGRGQPLEAGPPLPPHLPALRRGQGPRRRHPASGGAQLRAAAAEGRIHFAHGSPDEPARRLHQQQVGIWDDRMDAGAAGKR